MPVGIRFVLTVRGKVTYVSVGRGDTQNESEHSNMTFSSLYSLVLDILHEQSDYKEGDADLVDVIVMANPTESEQARPEFCKFYKTNTEFKDVVLKLRNEMREAHAKKTKKV